MTRIKRQGVTVAIVLLVGLNIWRWWPSSHVYAGKAEAPSSIFRTEDFEVKVVLAESSSPYQRDIFHPKRTVVAKPVVSRVEPIAVQAPPVKSSEEIEHDAAQAEFAQIRCVGVSIRDKRIQAYLINRGDPILVSMGDKASSRFVVENIGSDGVVLRDPDTGVGGKIAVAGK